MSCIGLVVKKLHASGKQIMEHCMDEPLFATLVASDNRPQSKRMRDLIPQIERVFAIGYSHKQIHSELVKNGLMISFLNYKKVLARERKKLATCEDGRRTVGHERSANEAKPRVPVASVSPAARGTANRADFERTFVGILASATPNIVTAHQGKHSFKWDPRQEIDPFKPSEEI
jgi:hypothetical protein